jgi:hypothetical protein
VAAVAAFDWSQTEEYAAYFKRSFPNFWSYLEAQRQHALVWHRFQAMLLEDRPL